VNLLTNTELRWRDLSKNYDRLFNASIKIENNRVLLVTEWARWYEEILFGEPTIEKTILGELNLCERLFNNDGRFVYSTVSHKYPIPILVLIREQSIRNTTVFRILGCVQIFLESRVTSMYNTFIPHQSIKAPG
jgi:hypothetical protein